MCSESQKQWVTERPAIKWSSEIKKNSEVQNGLGHPKTGMVGRRTWERPLCGSGQQAEACGGVSPEGNLKRGGNRTKLRNQDCWNKLISVYVLLRCGCWPRVFLLYFIAVLRETKYIRISKYVCKL